MNLCVLTILIAQVPAVTAGPDLVENAREVLAPIADVTVFSDRARIRRKAQVDVAAGISVLRLPDLPGAAMLDTIRVSSSAGRVLRVEATPVDRELYSIDQVETLIAELERVRDRLLETQGLIAVERAELELLRGVTPLLPVPEAEREGRPPLAIEPAGWIRAIDFFFVRRTKAQSAVRELEKSARELEIQQRRLSEEIAQKDLGAFSERRVEVVVIVDAKSPSRSTLELEYFMPGAVWRPIYDLRFAADRGEVTIETAALVEQATGEDWDGVDLGLSTAIPGRGIDLPELLTWTLGEKKEFMPTPRPKQSPPALASYAPPEPRPTAAERKRELDRELLVDRLRDIGALEADRTGEEAEQTRRYSLRESRPMPEPQMKSRAMSDAAAAEVPPPPMAPSSAPLQDFSSESIVSMSLDSGTAYRRTPLSLFETPSPTVRISDPTLPAAAAGGMDYVFRSPTAAQIPSTGEKHRVPLGAKTYPVKVRYEATPSLSKTAFLAATVSNTTGAPILGGPVNIFVGAEFAGDGKLETTGAGGAIELPLGADEDVRLERKVIPTSRTQGVFSKSDITDYVTEIEVGNYKKREIEVVVLDQIPKVAGEDIEVRTGRVEPAAEGPDEQGLLRWRVRIPPGNTRKIRFEYTIERPANWQLHQQ